MVTEAQPKLTTYTWWDQVPENLKTKTSLGELGKKLAKGQKPAAWISYRAHGHLREFPLYDISSAVAKSEATPAQLAALEAARIKKRTCKTCARVVDSEDELTKYRSRYDNFFGPTGQCGACEVRSAERYHAKRRNKSILWARELLEKPETWVVLDTETYGLHGSLIEIAVVDAAGETLFQSLVNPGFEMNVEHMATCIHGIAPEHLEGQPCFGEINQALSAAIQGRTIIAYNADYDRGILASEYMDLMRGLRRNVVGDWRAAWGSGQMHPWERGIAFDRLADMTVRIRISSDWECAMEKYAAYYGDWDPRWQDYRYVALGGTHRGADDCRATLDQIRRMAESELEDIDQ